MRIMAKKSSPAKAKSGKPVKAAPAVSKIESLQKRQDRVYNNLLAQLNSIGK